MAAMVKSFRESSFEMRAVLRTIFTSDFFKNARFNKIKSPAELVVSTLRLVGGEEIPRPGYGADIAMQPTYMGQDLLNPPSVEGWHTGKEWINSGSLMSRINFAAEMVANTNRPGVRFIINRLKARGTISPEQFVDTALDLMGPLEVGEQSRQELLTYAREGGTRPSAAMPSSSSAAMPRPLRRNAAASSRRDTLRWSTRRGTGTPCSCPRVLIQLQRALCRWAAIMQTVRCGTPGTGARQRPDGTCSTRKIVTRLLVAQAERSVVRRSGTGAIRHQPSIL